MPENLDIKAFSDINDHVDTYRNAAETCVILCNLLGVNKHQELRVIVPALKEELATARDMNAQHETRLQERTNELGQAKVKIISLEEELAALKEARTVTRYQIESVENIDVVQEAATYPPEGLLTWAGRVHVAIDKLKKELAAARDDADMYHGDYDIMEDTANYWMKQAEIGEDKNEKVLAIIDEYMNRKGRGYLPGFREKLEEYQELVEKVRKTLKGGEQEPAPTGSHPPLDISSELVVPRMVVSGKAVEPCNTCDFFNSPDAKCPSLPNMIQDGKCNCWVQFIPKKGES